MIIDGWIEDASNVPKNLRKYFSHAFTLTVEDGLILQGEGLLIPESKWAQVLQQLHDGHQGITKMNHWVKNVIYWPSMADLGFRSFYFNGGQYMVMADMYSKMCFVQKMASPGATSAAIISKMKETFVEHQVPDILRSDNRTLTCKCCI